MKQLLFLLIFPQWLIGQADLHFDHLSVAQGLSQGQANFILKDSKGFVWIGTQDGLNRYDGYTFKQFYHQEGDSTSLSNNYIWCLLEDSAGDIWVGNFGGELCRFDRETETFHSFKLKPFTQPTIAGNSVRGLCEYPNGTIWIGADRGLWSLDARTFNLEKKDFYIPEQATEKSQSEELLNVVAVRPLEGDQLLVGAGQGLFKVNISSGQTESLKHAGQSMPATQCIINSQEKNGFWVGTYQGLYHLKYFPQNDSVFIEKDFLFEKNSPGQFINSLYLDDHSTLWIGTTEGLVRYAESGIDHFMHSENQENSLSSDMVFSILEIEPGLMWAGTREAINVFSNNTPPFQNLRSAETKGLLCSDALLGILEDREDNLWIGTYKGLTRIGHFSKGKEEWEIECLNPENTLSMPYDYVINVKQDRSGGLWCCFRRNGFAKLKKGVTGNWYFEKTNAFDAELGGAGMNTLLFDDESFTWLGTPGQGLIKWQQESGNYEVFKADSTENTLKHDYIFCLFEDSQGRFWVGTANGGLCEMDKKTGTFTCHVFDDGDGHSISSNMVLSIMEDSQQRLWACTAHGLNLLEGDGRFHRFYQKNGLPNDVIYGMVEDTEGFFWASTNKGISKISFVDDVFETQNFTVADGLAGDEFNQHSFLKSTAGQFFFGGTNGLTFFDPADIQPYPHAPKVALTDFQLFNQSVPVGDILQKAINEVAAIHLKYNQNFIAFEFAALGFTQPENNEYAYQLEGLDEDWVYSGQRRFASYPNLSPGDYVFKIKAANHDGIWNETPKTVAIRILPPWWQTGWAYGIYALLIVLGIYGTVRFREQSVRKMEQAKSAEREKFRKRTARDFHDEAGNKITKMSLLTEVAKRQVSSHESLSPLLAQMEQNIQELRAGMRDFIWVLDPENDNLYDTLLRLKDFSHSLFEHASIHFQLEGLDEHLRQIPLNGNERRHLLLIFKETMNNCVKYSEATNAVLSVKQEKGQTTLVFKDNGMGFDPAAAKGNGLRNMRERAGKMGAKILIEGGDGVRVEVVLGKE